MLKPVHHNRGRAIEALNFLINMYKEKLQLCSFEQAEKLKELGFNWACTDFYAIDEGGIKYADRHPTDHNFFPQRVSAPAIVLALKWFRDVKGIPNSVRMTCYHEDEERMSYWSDFWKPVFNSERSGNWHNLLYTPPKPRYTYEQAESLLLDELLKTE